MRSSFHWLCSQVLNLVCALELVDLLPHQCQEQAQGLGAQHRGTCNISLKLLVASLGGVIPNTSDGSKQ